MGVRTVGCVSRTLPTRQNMAPWRSARAYGSRAQESCAGTGVAVLPCDRCTAKLLRCCAAALLHCCTAALLYCCAVSCAEISGSACCSMPPQTGVASAREF